VWGLIAGIVGLYALYGLVFVIVDSRSQQHKLPRPWPIRPIIKLPGDPVKPSTEGAGPRRVPRRTVVEHSPPTSHPRLTLRVVRGSLQGQSYSVNTAEYRIGADADNELQIPSDDYVSGKHLVIQAFESGWTVSDRGSRNGTFLDNQRLKHGVGQPLRTNQTLRIGNSEFLVILEEAAAPEEGAKPAVKAVQAPSDSDIPLR
jgi:hypothetical protein